MNVRPTLFLHIFTRLFLGYFHAIKYLLRLVYSIEVFLSGISIRISVKIVSALEGLGLRAMLVMRFLFDIGCVPGGT